MPSHHWPRATATAGFARKQPAVPTAAHPAQPGRAFAATTAATPPRPPIRSAPAAAVAHPECAAASGDALCDVGNAAPPWVEKAPCEQCNAPCVVSHGGRGGAGGLILWRVCTKDIRHGCKTFHARERAPRDTRGPIDCPARSLTELRVWLGALVAAVHSTAERKVLACAGLGGGAPGDFRRFLFWAAPMVSQVLREELDEAHAIIRLSAWARGALGLGGIHM